MMAVVAVAAYGAAAVEKCSEFAMADDLDERQRRHLMEILEGAIADMNDFAISSITHLALATYFKTIKRYMALCYTSLDALQEDDASDPKWAWYIDESRASLALMRTVFPE